MRPRCSGSGGKAVRPRPPLPSTEQSYFSYAAAAAVDDDNYDNADNGDDTDNDGRCRYGRFQRKCKEIVSMRDYAAVETVWVVSVRAAACRGSGHDTQKKLDTEMRIPTNETVYLEVIPTNRKAIPKVHRGRRAVTCFECHEIGHYKCECLLWKTRLCWHWQSAACKESALCSFAHGECELRVPLIS